ncbi:MAG: 16S rRNA (guanine(527)-N(7))-methyltransferase RsmG [Nocardioides sp.]
MFSSAGLPLIEAYAASLADAGVVRGLIGPREVPRLWDRHLLNCAVLGEAIPEGSTVCDIGSGAGLPGLVLAIARPDLRITLVEPLLRRTTYLSEVVEELGLPRVEVVRGRADALHGQRTFDVVTSRAVAPLGRLLDWSMPLVAPTGALIAMKGQSVTDEIAAEAARLTRAGCSPAEVLELGASVVSPPSVVVRVAWADPSKVGWVGAPGQTPTRSKSRRSRGRKA